MGLEHVIENKLHLGKFQIWTLIVLFFIGNTNGVEISLGSFFNPILIHLYPNLSSAMLSVFASLFFAGVVFGFLIGGVISDKYGRKNIIISGSLIQFGVGALFYLANSALLFFIIRFFYGFAYGYTTGTLTTMFIEISPAKYRGKALLIINYFMTIGKVLGLLLGYIFFKEDI